jgi:hypothetical protein
MGPAWGLALTLAGVLTALGIPALDGPGTEAAVAGADEASSHLADGRPAPTSGDPGYELIATPDDLTDRFSDDELALLEMLNRVDLERMPRRDSLAVPRTGEVDPAAHSPFPDEVPALREHPRALVVHQPLQVFAAYEEGRRVRWGPVSSGRQEHVTPGGRFFLTWKSRGRYSTVNPEWYLEWYFNFHNERGISFHKYALPGEPASHACVRLLERDAVWIYEWGEGWTLDDRGWEVLEEGTPVWIVGEYDFDAPRPWLDSADPHPPVPAEDLDF